MSKSAFNSIMAGLLDAIAYAKGDKTQGKKYIIKVKSFKKEKGN